MKRDENDPNIAKKVDVILHGVETIGSAERSTDKKEMEAIQKLGVANLKRIQLKDFSKIYSSEHETPYYIEDFLEMKTTWHPIEKIGATGSGY